MQEPLVSLPPDAAAYKSQVSQYDQTLPRAKEEDWSPHYYGLYLDGFDQKQAQIDLFQETLQKDLSDVGKLSHLGTVRMNEYQAICFYRDWELWLLRAYVIIPVSEHIPVLTYHGNRDEAVVSQVVIKPSHLLNQRDFRNLGFLDKTHFKNSGVYTRNRVFPTETDDLVTLIRLRRRR